MKLNKILGVAVAFCGVLVSVGLASALYIQEAEDATLKIGATYETDDGTIDYLVNGNKSGSLTPKFLDKDGNEVAGAAGFSDDVTQIKFEFSLGADYGDDMPQQKYITGDLALNFTGINTNLLNNSKVWAQIDGYGADTYGAQNFSTCILSSDKSVTEAAFSIGATNLTVYSGGLTPNKVVVYFKLNTGVTLDLLTLNEASAFSLGVSWTKPASYDYARVTGGGIGWKTNEDLYRMNVDIDRKDTEEDHCLDGQGKVKFQWYFENLPANDLISAKCVKEVTGSDPIWSYGDDTALTANKLYKVYWAGGNSEQAYFVEQ